MPYLVLKYINFFNFKSFEGYVQVGPFCKGMNCILGPNGAGKSNIIDGILFVFGKNAKQMRTKIMTELIHNMGRVEKEKAFVELQFVEIQGKVEVPDSDFKIRRTVLKNGTTHYEYNGQKTEKQFIQDLLIEKGIDMESDRYLVLQGEIEQLALMKPTSGNYDEPGFIEYIETVTGSIKFLEPIEQQESKIQTLLIELQMVRDQHRLLTTEIDGLQLAVQPTLNYFEAQSTRNRVRYISHKIKELGYREEMTYRLEHTFLEFIQQKDDLKKQLDSANSEQRILNEQIKKSEIERDGIEQKVDIIRDQMENIQENDYKERNNAKENMLRLDKLNKQIRDSGDIQKKLFEDEQNHAQTFKNCEAKLQQLKDELILVKDQVGVFDQQQDGHRSALNEKIRQSEILLRGCKKNFTDQQRQCDQIKKDMQQIVIPDISQLRMYQKDYNLNKEMLEKVGASIEGLRNLLDEIQQLLKQTKSISSKENDQIMAFQSQVRRIKDTINVDVARNDNEDRDLLTLQQLYNQNKIAKVYFRLCSAGLIDTKYETTLQVAMGIGAQIFVMDTLADGIDVLMFVKQNKIYTNKIQVLGRDLDEKIMEQYRNRPRQSNIPGLTRLMDLITFSEPWVEPLFYKFLRNNYFCETIQQANQIRKNYQIQENIYTLKGEISKGRGDMKTAAQYQKGYWQTRGEQNRVSELPNEQLEQIKYLEQKIEILKISKAQNDGKILLLDGDLKQVEGQYQTDLKNYNGYVVLEKEYDEKIADLKLKEKQIPVLRQKNAVLEEKLVEESTLLKQYENELATQTQIKVNLDKQLIDIDPPNIREKRKQIKELEAKIVETEKSYLQSKTNMINCGKRSQQLIIDVQRANEEIIECQKSLEQSEINYKEAENQMKQLFQIVNDDVVAMDVIDNYLEQLYKQREALNEKERDVQLKLIQLQRQMDQSTKLHIEQEEFVKQIEYLYSKIWQNQKQLIQLYQRDSMDEMFNWNQHMLTENKELTELDPNQKLDSPEDLQSFFKIKSILHKIPDIAKELLITKVDQILTEEDLELYKNNNDSISEFMNFCDKRFINRPDEKQIEIYKEFKHMVLKLKEYKENYDQTVFEILQANKEKLELEEERKRVLISGVMQISSKLQDYYRILSRGTGSATLEPVNQTQVLQGGVDICVKPPGKPYRSISKLSGGEKTMASLALLFAIHFTHPNKVYFLDEIDAALDQSNLTSMISFLIAIAGHSQFIIVSHRQVIQDNCDKLFGVMKINNQTLIIGASVPTSRVRIIAEMKVKMNENKKLKSQQFQISLQGKDQNTEFGRIDQLQTAVSTQQNMIDFLLVQHLEEAFDNEIGLNLQQTNSSVNIQRIMSKDKAIIKQTYDTTRELQKIQDGWKEDEISDDDVEEQKVKASKQLKKRIARTNK